MNPPGRPGARKTPAEQSVSNAVRNLIDKAKSKNCRPHELARRKIELCAVNDRDCVRFWRSVWVELMLKEYGIPRAEEPNVTQGTVLKQKIGSGKRNEAA